MVSLPQQVLLADITGATCSLGGSIEPTAVVIDHVHAKTVRTPSGNTLPNAPHAQDAQRTAMHVGAGKHVIAPTVPQAGTQKALAFRHASGCCHDQRKAKISRGFGQ